MFISRKFKPKTPAHEIANVIAESLLIDFSGLLRTPIEIVTDEHMRGSKLSKSGVAEEVFVYLLHCLDRCAFAHFDPKYRSVFVDQIGRSSLSYFISDFAPKSSYRVTDTAADYLVKKLNVRQLEYSQYVIVERGEPLANDLFWNFGTNLCLMAEIHDPVRITRMACYAMEIFELSDQLIRHVK